jgi:hypothetical protein
MSHWVLVYWLQFFKMYIPFPQSVLHGVHWISANP